MPDMELKTYIEKCLKLKRVQAAKKLGISRQHLYDILKRNAYPSRKLALRIEDLSNGKVKAKELLRVD
jgi:DNA-binding XRE family transcriptional regulator